MAAVAKIGILELTALPATTLAGKVWTWTFAPRYASVMSQAVSVWLRKAGHRVHYAVYAGMGSPLRLVPQSLDYLFLVTTSRTAGLAERVAEHYHDDTCIVACGPYPASQATRPPWADVLVKSCNQEAIADLLESENDTLVVDEPFDIRELPSLAERESEVRSTFTHPFPRRLQVVPLLHSVGCPNRCSFCVERDRDYQRVRSTRVFGDLYAANKLFPGAIVAWHDPNWGRSRNLYLQAMETLPRRTNRYMIELELRHVDRELLGRLKKVGVAYVAVGIESWTQFNGKAGIKAESPAGKMLSVVSELHTIHEFIPHVQANFILGFDDDTAQTWDLLKRAIARTPWCQWNINPLYPFPGTEVCDTLRMEGRLLDLPPEFMVDPFLVYRPKGTTAVEFYQNLLSLNKYRLRCGLSAFARASLPTATMAALPLAGVANNVRTLRKLLRHKVDVERFYAGGPTPKPLRDIHKQWLSLGH